MYVVVAMASICWSFVMVLLLTLAALIAPSQPLFQPPAGVFEVFLQVCFLCCSFSFVRRSMFDRSRLFLRESDHGLESDSSGYELRSTYINGWRPQTECLFVAGPHQIYTRELETGSNAGIGDRVPNHVRFDGALYRF